MTQDDVSRSQTGSSPQKAAQFCEKNVKNSQTHFTLSSDWGPTAVTMSRNFFFIRRLYVRSLGLKIVFPAQKVALQPLK